MIRSFPQPLITALTQVPHHDGALDRNKKGYVHVRFQIGIQTLGDALLKDPDVRLADALVRACEYSFDHQTADGGFTLVLPDSEHAPVPSDAEIASGVSFFLAGLGTAVLSMSASDLGSTPEVTRLRARMDALRPHTAAALNWLKARRGVLLDYDARTANRLFFDATAFLLAGRVVEDPEAGTIGRELLARALDLQSPDGYFTELAGSDSSYNGVSLRLAAALYAHLAEVSPTGDDPLTARLADALLRAGTWQQARITSRGEISTAGNTRVYPGGETFLGREKRVAFKDTILAFRMLHFLTGARSYLQDADLVQAHYT